MDDTLWVRPDRVPVNTELTTGFSFREAHYFLKLKKN